MHRANTCNDDSAAAIRLLFPVGAFHEASWAAGGSCTMAAPWLCGLHHQGFHAGFVWWSEPGAAFPFIGAKLPPCRSCRGLCHQLLLAEVARMHACTQGVQRHKAVCLTLMCLSHFLALHEQTFENLCFRQCAVPGGFLILGIYFSTSQNFSFIRRSDLHPRMQHKKGVELRVKFTPCIATPGHDYHFFVLFCFGFVPVQYKFCTSWQSRL